MSHMTRKHKQCVKCQKSFLLRDDLLTHLQFNHGEFVTCAICDFKGFPAFELAYHNLIEHGDCEKCELKSNQSHLRNQHQSRIGEIANMLSKDGPNYGSSRARQGSLNSEDDSDENVNIQTLDSSDDENDSSFGARPRKPGPKSAQRRALANFGNYKCFSLVFRSIIFNKYYIFR